MIDPIIIPTFSPVDNPGEPGGGVSVGMEYTLSAQEPPQI